MTQAARARARHSADPAAPRRPRWAGPLAFGVAFGLAYGLTQRLVSLNVADLIRFGQGFDVQVFPGTSLESLRLRFGAADAELRGNLELQELQRQSKESEARPEPVEPPEATGIDDLRDPGLADPEPALEPLPEEPEPGSEPAAAAPAAPALPVAAPPPRP